MSTMTQVTEQERNKILVSDFYSKVWNAHDLTALEGFVADDYIQHNPQVANGRPSLEAFLGPLFEALPKGASRSHD